VRLLRSLGSRLKHKETCAECYGDGFRYQADYDIAERNAQHAGEDLFGFNGPKRKFWPVCASCNGKGRLKFGRG
jgi:DnaJ-class molecular chaperone